jgi:acyl-CoA dehydrogenase
MSERHEVKLPTIGLSGFDAGWSEEELGIQEAIHRFAKEVMRPLGREIDKMPASEAYLPGSPFWTFLQEAQKAGLNDDSAMEGMTPAQRARIEGIVIQELAWGDAGLTAAVGVGALPAQMAAATGNQELIDLTAGRLGCWCATQPDRGSDGLTLYPVERFPGSRGNKGNLQATFKGDEIIINGQSSAWVSNGPVAQVALMDIVADYGNGFYDEHGNTYGCNVIVPLDLKGVSRGKPLEKLGKRPQPQGEIYFDNVKVPARWAMATRDDYEEKHAMAWAQAGTAMNHLAAGVARSAFELALAYVHERKQGGTVLANLQMTQYRLGFIGAKVEAIKAMARHVSMFTKTAARPHPYFTATGKAFCCSEMFTVVNESMQLFGANGLTREYPMEKLLRDARAMQIEDGEAYVLFMHYGHLLSRLHEQEGYGRA